MFFSLFFHLWSLLSYLFCLSLHALMRFSSYLHKRQKQGVVLRGSKLYLLNSKSWPYLTLCRWYCHMYKRFFFNIFPCTNIKILKICLSANKLLLRTSNTYLALPGVRQKLNIESNFLALTCNDRRALQKIYNNIPPIPKVQCCSKNRDSSDHMFFSSSVIQFWWGCF